MTARGTPCEGDTKDTCHDQFSSLSRGFEMGSYLIYDVTAACD